MNCSSARFALALIQPNSPDSNVPEFAAELAHVRECPDCQAYRTQLQQSDQELALAVRNIDLPAGFKSRMLQRLRATLEVAIVEVATVQTVNGAAPVATALSGVVLAGNMGPTKVEAGRTSSSDQSCSLEQSGDAVLSSTTALPISPRSTPQPLRDASTKPGMSRRKLLGMASVTAAGVLGLGLWLFMGRERPKLLIGDILAMGQNLPKAEAGPFQHSFELELPTATFHFSRELQLSNAISFRMAGRQHDSQGREIGAVFSFTITNSRRVHIPAYLFVVDLQRVDVPEINRLAADFASADVQYPLPHKFPTRVWSDGERLYVCYAESADSTDLELLLPRFSEV